MGGTLAQVSDGVWHTKSSVTARLPGCAGSALAALMIPQEPCERDLQPVGCTTSCWCVHSDLVRASAKHSQLCGKAQCSTHDTGSGACLDHTRNRFVAEERTVASVRVIFAYVRVAGTRAAGVNSASLQKLRPRAHAGTLSRHGPLTGVPPTRS